MSSFQLLGDEFPISWFSWCYMGRGCYVAVIISVEVLTRSLTLGDVHLYQQPPSVHQSFARAVVGAWSRCLHHFVRSGNSRHRNFGRQTDLYAVPWFHANVVTVWCIFESTVVSVSIACTVALTQAALSGCIFRLVESGYCTTKTWCHLQPLNSVSVYEQHAARPPDILHQQYLYPLADAVLVSACGPPAQSL